MDSNPSETVSSLFYPIILFLRTVGIIPVIIGDKNRTQNRTTVHYTFSIKSQIFLYCCTINTILLLLWGQVLGEATNLDGLGKRFFLMCV